MDKVNDKIRLDEKYGGCLGVYRIMNLPRAFLGLFGTLMYFESYSIYFYYITKQDFLIFITKYSFASHHKFIAKPKQISKQKSK